MTFVLKSWLLYLHFPQLFALCLDSTSVKGVIENSNNSCSIKNEFGARKQIESDGISPSECLQLSDYMKSLVFMGNSATLLMTCSPTSSESCDLTASQLMTRGSEQIKAWLDGVGIKYEEETV